MLEMLLVSSYRHREASKTTTWPSTTPELNFVEFRGTKKIIIYFLWPRGQHGTTKQECNPSKLAFTFV